MYLFRPQNEHQNESTSNEIDFYFVPVDSKYMELSMDMDCDKQTAKLKLVSSLTKKTTKTEWNLNTASSVHSSFSTVYSGSSTFDMSDIQKLNISVSPNTRPHSWNAGTKDKLEKAQVLPARSFECLPSGNIKTLGGNEFDLRSGKYFLSM